MQLAVVQPFWGFTGADGGPLNNGYIAVGVVNQNPETSPVQLYWDADMTIPAAQPIRTLAGYPSRQGTAPPGTINTSNTASVVLAALDMAMSGAAGMPLPVMSGLKIIAKNVKDRKLRSRINAALMKSAF